MKNLGRNFLLVLAFAIICLVAALAFSYTNFGKREIKEDPGSMRELQRYTTYCLKGNTMLSIDKSFFYQLDTNGKTVPCKS